ncbi:MAG: outer membrane homotrimeric porin [Solidesulfovibrio sp. DCME]|uniref:outer membrane homotrimeric porin n=1 Tax=Solidesulfovibrio sp. DCME TaxID=3447380 RepID=UPI003D0C795E
MRRLGLLAVIVVLAGLAGSGRALAATEVRMTGDARVYGDFFANRNFTGWNNPYWTSETPTWRPAGVRTEERFQIWERFRLRTDFRANEAVQFRLGVKVEDVWGHGTLTAANPTASLEVYEAYLQFKWPDSAVQVTAGLQPCGFTQSSFFNGSPIFDAKATSLVVTAPLVPDRLTLVLAYTRTIASARTYEPNLQEVYRNQEGYALILPVTLEGFTAKPFFDFSVGGKGAYYITEGGWAEGLISAGLLAQSPAGWKDNFINVLWAGLPLELTALDPFRFYADVLWGHVGLNEYQKNQRRGWFVDAAAEYVGFGWFVPQAFGWWSTGEDSSMRNGSERLPVYFPGHYDDKESTQAWNAGNSFLFDGGQELGKGSNMTVSPAGNWGFGVSINKVKFLDSLEQRLTAVYVRGNNAPRAIRDANAILGSNPLFVMGRDLTVNEWIVGLNFDSKYKLYENLALVVETGWAHPGAFQTSVWGSRLAHKAEDAWKAALGFTYTF